MTNFPDPRVGEAGVRLRMTKIGTRPLANLFVSFYVAASSAHPSAT
jgi:hypothetical protein